MSFLIKSGLKRGTVFQRRARKRVKAVLVEARPKLALRRGAILYDGESKYRVIDVHRRAGEPWIKLENVQFPELSEWYRLADCYALAVLLDPPKRG